MKKTLFVIAVLALLAVPVAAFACPEPPPPPPGIGVGSCYDPTTGMIHFTLTNSKDVTVHFRMERYGTGQFVGPFVLSPGVTHKLVSPPSASYETLKKFSSWDGTNWVATGGTHGWGNAQRYIDLDKAGQKWALCPSTVPETPEECEWVEMPFGIVELEMAGGRMEWVYVYPTDGELPGGVSIDRQLCLYGEIAEQSHEIDFVYKNTCTGEFMFDGETWIPRADVLKDGVCNRSGECLK